MIHPDLTRTLTIINDLKQSLAELEARHVDACAREYVENGNAILGDRSVSGRYDRGDGPGCMGRERAGRIGG